VFLAEGNDEIQTFAAHGSHQPFAISIRLRRPRRRAQYSQPEGTEFFIHLQREDRITIVDEKTIRMIKGKVTL
jgi:hypothetical protein